jgi:hypothetical protein
MFNKKYLFILGLLMVGCENAPITIVDPTATTTSPSEPLTQWIRQFSPPNSFSSDNHAKDVAVDSGNNVVTVGYSQSSFDGESTAGNQDAFIIKHDANGNKIWSHQFGTSGTDLIHKVVINSGDSIFVTGSTGGSLDGPLLGNVDVFVRKYNSDGSLAWGNQFGSTASEGANAIAIDSDGNIYVGGMTYGAFPGAADASAGDGFLMKLDAGGNFLWNKKMGVLGATDNINVIKVDISGNVYTAGSLIFTKLDSSGNIIWNLPIDFDIYGLAVATTGDIYISGRAISSINGQNILGSGDGYVSRYNNSGSHVWTKTFGSNGHDELFGLALDSNNQPVVCGYLAQGLSATSNTWGMLAVKYDVNGGLLWAHGLGNPANSTIVAVGIAVDSNNRTILTGFAGTNDLETGQPFGAVQSGFVLKLNK